MMPKRTLDNGLAIVDYSTLQSFSGIVGLIVFIVAFAAILFYALRPKNKAKFDRAARLPLEDDRDLNKGDGPTADNAPKNDRDSNHARDGDYRG